jgi:hypothetical protein
MNFRFLSLLLAVLILSFSGPVYGQQSGTIQGTVTDETGAIIPATNVRIVGSDGTGKTAQTNESGRYSFAGLKPGKYTVNVAMPGFANSEKTVDVAPGAIVTADVPMRVAMETQKIEVQGDNPAQVSTDPTANAGAIVLRGEDLEALSDDPDELASDLQALAGPAAGPNGGQIFIDGFSGAQLPPKESIREIRINQNPFSAEFDRLGFGRIEIFTKPGSDRYHGQALFSISNGIFNSRNPFATNKPDFQSKLYDVNVGGPLNKRASFFVSADRRAVDDNSIVNATILDPSFNITQFQQAFLTPNTRTSVSPRIDYAINANNTLVGRYSFRQLSATDSGIGDFTLLSRGITTDSTSHTLQLTETAVLSAKAINETRLQYINQSGSQVGDNTIPSINVLGAFNGGGAQVGNNWTNENHWELHNITSIAHGTHAFKIGGRMRRVGYEESSARNFGGTFSFAGNPSLGISSIDQYRQTVVGLAQGLSLAEIRALGGGPTQFTIASGNPLAGVTQWDGALFVQDDWRWRPNLTVSLGLRYEMQTNVHDWSNLAPRIGIAWAPGSRGGRTGKTVVRGGFGMFYDRIDSDLTLDTLRFNGLNQQQLIIDRPDFYNVIPPFSQLTGQLGAQTVHVFDPNLRAPYMMQSAISVERQLPWKSTISTTFTNTRALHMLRSVNVGSYDPTVGNRYEYQSTGVLNQNQLMFNFNTRFSPKLTLFSFYVLSKAKSDTDGVNTFPSDPFNFQTEYGRASNDIRHRFVLGGNVIAPLGLRFNPFVIANSGRPFNIIVGRDLNGDSILTNDRPAFAQPGQDGALNTAYGWFNPRPGPGDVLIPRNYGDGPGSFTVNLRASRTFGFGGTRKDNRPAGMGGGGMRGPGGRGGGRGGMGGGFGGGGMRGMMDSGGTEQRFNVTLSVQARNLFNTVNLALPVGNLSSVLFGQSTQTAGGFGGGTEANNRRLEFQLRLTF